MTPCLSLTWVLGTWTHVLIVGQQQLTNWTIFQILTTLSKVWKFSGTRLALSQHFLLFPGTLHGRDLTHIVSFHYISETQNGPWADSENPYVVAQGTETDWSDCAKLHASFKCHHPRWKQNFSLFSMSLLEVNPLGRRFHPFWTESPLFFGATKFLGGGVTRLAAMKASGWVNTGLVNVPVCFNY